MTTVANVSNIVEGSSSIDRRIAAWLVDAGPIGDVGARLRAMLAARLDGLPLPGGGATPMRWRALAAVARHELSLVKLYESNTDALAILPRSTMPRHRRGARRTPCGRPRRPAIRSRSMPDPARRCACPAASRGVRAPPSSTAR